jgi:hypothetical protein
MGSSSPDIPIGRLSAINGGEVAIYLKKMKEYELAQVTGSPLIQNRAWMKNVVHIVGASDPALVNLLKQYLANYEGILKDSLYGANVSTFAKTSTNTVEQLNNARLQNLFSDGISLITYFGHSSSSTLEFNLDNPQNYNNFGKYPLFIGLGCNAGNFFNYNTARFVTNETISEKYVLAPDRGTIGFIASTHFGIVDYLDKWSSRAFKNIAYKMYGRSIGDIMKTTAEEVFAATTQDDFYARCNIEESELHGDPALRINSHPKPDYVIEDPMLKISPPFISVADTSFRVDAKFLNIGKAIAQNVVIEIKHQHADLTVTTRRDTIPYIKYSDSLIRYIPIDPFRDKGINKITVTIDPDNLIDELYENNNSVSKDVVIYEDEARPVYPYDYAIINKQNIKLIASTANPFSVSKQYRMEMDTTELFNSPFKLTKNVTQVGGVLEFDPGISFTDSTVYYWRVAPVPATGNFAWNTSSFVYLAGSELGFNQSHLFQHLKSGLQRMALDSGSRLWSYKERSNNIFMRNGVYPTTSDQGGFYVGTINDVEGFLGPGCNYDELIINVIDPVNFKPWKNDYSGSAGLYQSLLATCGGGRLYNFQYFLNSVQSRKKIMDFLDLVPDGFYVAVRGNVSPNQASNTYADTWKSDQSIYGTGNSLYHRLFNQGVTSIDSFYKPRSYIFLYKKNRQNEFATKVQFSNGIYDGITVDADCSSIDTLGFMTSPKFGPAKAWKQLKWRGKDQSAPSNNDIPTVDVIGVNNSGTETVLFSRLTLNDQDFNLSSVNATLYPFIKLRMRNLDSINLTPYQLRYWRLTYLPAPEGAVAPNIYMSMKDTVDVGQPLDFKLAFKNVSEAGFDSIKVKMVVTDRNNVQHVLQVPRHRPLLVNDTLHIRFPFDTRQFGGWNSLYVDVNPDNDQAEQYHFNNFVYKQFFVRADTINPLMDVTFDQVHILNHDIVASRPGILIKLKDEAKWFLLDDPSTMTVNVKFPDGTLHPYNFGNDTLQFIAASQAPNNDNTASAVFKPYFPEDGEYELIVSGKDMSQNKAGNLDYHVSFQVINKPMISNMLNYPNPFTTSTAFVFTVTGSEVPQNIRIQILTVTGKIVREITKEELGPIHIGRNITEFKWDGTDQYGQKLGNGVYIYRVVTNLNGKSLDKYRPEGGNTDQYFNKGYGKMYLMR